MIAGETLIHYLMHMAVRKIREVIFVVTKRMDLHSVYRINIVVPFTPIQSVQLIVGIVAMTLIVWTFGEKSINESVAELSISNGMKQKNKC